MSHGPETIIEIGNSLLKRFPETFSTDFEENGDHVKKLTEVESKQVQNRIAGYVTRENSASTEQRRAKKQQ